MKRDYYSDESFARRTLAKDIALILAARESIRLVGAGGRTWMQSEAAESARPPSTSMTCHEVFQRTINACTNCIVAPFLH